MATQIKTQKSTFWYRHPRPGTFRFYVSAQMKTWLCNGLAHQGPLNEQHWVSEIVYAYDEKDAYDIMMATNRYSQARVYDAQPYRENGRLVTGNQLYPVVAPSTCPF